MIMEFFDYTTLRFIWWMLLGILLIGFAVMDGFDLGVGCLLPLVAKNDTEKRVTLNTIGPVWEGNQVWLILGGGAIFAAWPAVYAVSFSGFYFAMLLVLFGLILRPVGFKYRGKVENFTWKAVADMALFLGGFIPALLFGIAIGNVLEGVPFYFDEDLRLFYTGTLWELLNPFALLCGLVSLMMLVMHGGMYLAIKTEGIIQNRSIAYAQIAGLIFMGLFACAGFWVANGLEGYVIQSALITNGPSNPVHKSVEMILGAWMKNYEAYPILMLFPAFGFIGAFFGILLVRLGRYVMAWITSAVAIAGTIGTVGVSMFPFILPSSTYPNMSLMIWDSSSSEKTLGIMLMATVVFFPIILAYTSWVYYVLRGKVTSDYIENNTKEVY